MTARKRVLIIGLDGFTWRLGRDFMAEGVMPHLAKLLQGGCHGDLRSVIPPETAPAWASFQTGCLPGKTSIFASHRYDHKLKKLSLNSYADIAVPSIWELADEANRKIVSLNMPVTSPPPKVKGVVIPGFLCPQLSEETVYPPEAYGRYIANRKDYLIVNSHDKDTVAETVARAILTERVRAELALELMKDIDWDIFCVQMQSSDPLQHRLWRFVSQAELGRERNEVVQFYRFCDETINRIMDAAGPEVLTLIVSDHGFCGARCSVAVNVWLRQRGYLQLLPDKPRSTWSAVKEALKRRSRAALLLARLWGRIRRLSVAGSSSPVQPYCHRVLQHVRRIVDFENTTVFCLGGAAGLLYINADPQRRATLQRRLNSELLREFGPGARDPVIAKITSGIETYGKECDFSALPDLVLEYERGCESKIDPLGEAVIESKEPDGTHDRQGIFVAYGPGVSNGIRLDADIVDISPTVLAYLGIPVPRYVDGKVLSELFNEPLVPQYADVHRPGPIATEYSDAEQARVEEQLRKLGYL
jgi:predicted AlkP superfamily phosphohydrolase/phosphomutase